MPDVSVIQQFITPPWGALNIHLDTSGPYSGNNTLTHFSGVVPTNQTAGLVVVVTPTIQLGYEIGWESDDAIYDQWEYDARLVQVVVQHQFTGGSWVTTQVENLHTLRSGLKWKEALPGRIGIWVLPGLEADLYYLDVLV